MQTEFAFFPGCVLTQAAKESKMALEAVAPRLGIKLKEIPGWSCCGASQAQDVDPVATLVANARNIALAEKQPQFWIKRTKLEKHVDLAPEPTLQKLVDPKDYLSRLQAEDYL